jgi:hypothetical protein
MLAHMASLNKLLYMARVIQDSEQTTDVGMYMDRLRNAFIVFGAEFQSFCGGQATVSVVTELVSGEGFSLES